MKEKVLQKPEELVQRQWTLTTTRVVSSGADMHSHKSLEKRLESKESHLPRLQSVLKRIDATTIVGNDPFSKKLLTTLQERDKDRRTDLWRDLEQDLRISAAKEDFIPLQFIQTFGQYCSEIGTEFSVDYNEESRQLEGGDFDDQLECFARSYKALAASTLDKRITQLTLSRDITSLAANGIACANAYMKCMKKKSSAVELHFCELVESFNEIQHNCNSLLRGASSLEVGNRMVNNILLAGAAAFDNAWSAGLLLESVLNDLIDTLKPNSFEDDLTALKSIFTNLAYAQRDMAASTSAKQKDKDTLTQLMDKVCAIETAGFSNELKQLELKRVL